MKSWNVKHNYKTTTDLNKEKNTMIKTGKYKNYGQLEDQANNEADVEAFVFRNGEVVKADEAAREGGTVINTAPEKNYAI